MSILDGKPIEMNTKLVLSASRMTDMPRFYPAKVAKIRNRLSIFSLSRHRIM
ncbi:hypothetical protein Psch_03592 [Pelotomaculum schinkii]|uniref:Uncharacterized protein n=1 Tax=Pelotomaculum schinkii TaxID=78350 RepID=A0A4Y7R874_9FIRM|nr:hypothetical protein Psch_03592 [Pelotomaculum schinkii]